MSEIGTQFEPSATSKENLTILENEQLAETAEQKLLDIFSAQKLDQRIQKALRIGYNRTGDTTILRQVLSALENSDHKPLNIVEFAAGYTTPPPLAYHDYGAPWLSRRIKAAFGDKVRIIVTDKTPDTIDSPIHTIDPLNFILYTVQKNGLLNYDQYYAYEASQLKLLHGSEMPVSSFDGTSITALQSGKTAHFLEELLLSELECISPDTPMRNLKTAKMLHSMGVTSADPKSIAEIVSRIENFDGSFYIRPPIDAKIEQAMFGIESKGNLDAGYNGLNDLINKGVSANSIDIIFGRHTGFSFKVDKKAVGQKLLIPHGKIITHQDDTTHAVENSIDVYTQE